MIHIAICDDEQEFVCNLLNLMKQYASQTGEEIRVTTYSDGLELIEKYDPTIDLIFLDIQMKLVNGLRAAEQIRKLDTSVGIIFLTTMTQHVLSGYQYQAINYIIKPMQYVRLKSELDKFIQQKRREQAPAILIFNDTGKYKILLNDLHYIETFNRNLLFHTAQENIICYRSMKEIEQELREQGFARAHTSYIINLFYVKGVKKLEIELVTGERLPISQPKRKQFMEQLTEYWGDRL